MSSRYLSSGSVAGWVSSGLRSAGSAGPERARLTVLAWIQSGSGRGRSVGRSRLSPAVRVQELWNRQRTPDGNVPPSRARRPNATTLDERTSSVHGEAFAPSVRSIRNTVRSRCRSRGDTSSPDERRVSTPPPVARASSSGVVIDAARHDPFSPDRTSDETSAAGAGDPASNAGSGNHDLGATRSTARFRSAVETTTTGAPIRPGVDGHLPRRWRPSRLDRLRARVRTHRWIVFRRTVTAHPSIVMVLPRSTVASGTTTLCPFTVYSPGYASVTSNVPLGVASTRRR